MEAFLRIFNNSFPFTDHLLNSGHPTTTTKKKKIRIAYCLMLSAVFIDVHCLVFFKHFVMSDFVFSDMNHSN